MRQNMMRACGAVVAAVALSTLGVTRVGAAGPAATEPQPVRVPAAGTDHAPANPGDQLWVQRYGGHRGDGASAVAVSPGGDAVFVTGTSVRAGSAQDYATVAYNAATGAQMWVKRYNGPGNGGDGASSVAVSPDGKVVFVTGTSYGASSGSDYATVAYDAVTGARLWLKRYNGPGNGIDAASSVVVSPAGGTVFVTGASVGAHSGYDYATVAYDAATGARLWVKRYNGPGKAYDAASSVVVSPAGGTVFVTGASDGVTSGSDYATVAYDAATGARLWLKRYNGPGKAYDAASSVAVSPAGGTVFVTGASDGVTSGDDYATVAYDAATGARLWAERYDDPDNSGDAASSLAVSPSGGIVFVTGYSLEASSGAAYATIAYDAATGAQMWVERYNGPGNGDNQASSVAVSPGGGIVFVTGFSPGADSGEDYATVAYDAATGAQMWVERYNGPGNGDDTASSVAVSPGGDRVFVTGYSREVGSGSDYATVAYSP